MQSVSRSLFYQSICLPFCQHCAALLTVAFTKSWHLVICPFSFVLQGCFDYSWPFAFSYTFQNQFVNFWTTNKERKACWDFGWNYMESRDQCGENWHLYNAKCKWVCGGRTRLPHCWWACQLVPSLDNRQPSTKAKHMPPLWPGNSIPRYEPNRTHTHTCWKTCVRMLMAAVFRIAQNGNKLKVYHG